VARVTGSRVADQSLWPEGERRIRWVARHSPVLNRLARERLRDGSLEGSRVAVVVHLEAKTAYLATLFADAGAEVVAAGSNPGTTQDAVCAALVRRGIEVHGAHGISYEEWEQDLVDAVAFAPELIVDDGAELTWRLLEHRPELAERVRGVSEETTTGVARLRALHDAGRLPFPAIAANDAWCKHLIDNRFGTGHSSVLAIMRLTGEPLAGKHVCLIGYGFVGRGLAEYAEGLGARITVVEVDPVPALEAHVGGHRVARLEEALPDADVVVTATGGIGALPAGALAFLKDGAVLANAGHHDLEIDVDALGEGEELRRNVHRHRLDGGRTVTLLAEGRLVNIAGADGHPVEIMDLSFSVQALAQHHLANASLPSGVHRLPAELDREIARTKLATLGIELDEDASVLAAVAEEWGL
jgi:adenosylhomocysteinase